MSSFQRWICTIKHTLGHFKVSLLSTLSGGWISGVSNCNPISIGLDIYYGPGYLNREMGLLGVKVYITGTWPGERGGHIIIEWSVKFSKCSSQQPQAIPIPTHHSQQPQAIPIPTHHSPSSKVVIFIPQSRIPIWVFTESNS